jgi:fructokinase
VQGICADLASTEALPGALRARIRADRFHPGYRGGMNRSARILVLGEALIDVFPDREVIGGAPFNVARNLAALGAHPLFISRVGAGPAGEAILGQMRQLDMPLHGMQRDREHLTGRVQVSLQDGQPSYYIEPDAAWDWLEAEPATACVRAARPALAYFGTLAQRSPASREAVCECLSASPALRLLDLNLRGIQGEREVAAESMELADVLKLNEDELRTLADWFRPGPQGHEAAAAHALISDYHLQRIVVTRGANGWSCYEAGSRHVMEGPSPQVPVVDAVGAGDAYSAVLLLGEMRGWSLETTLLRAAEFAARVCTIHGAFDPDSGIYAEALEHWSP